jgi:hypothetical protein
MGWITKTGTQWGDVPQTFGSVYWVAPGAGSYTVEGRSYSASDNNDGLSPERALATIAQAISNATASAGDVIMLLPGTFTAATTITIAKAGLTFVGVYPSQRLGPDVRPYAACSKTNWTSTFAGNGITLTAADTTFIGINFIPLTARAMLAGTTCPRTQFIDCSVTMSAAASTSTKGFVFSGGSSSFCNFQNCFFIDSVATSAQGPCLDLTALDSFVVENCTIVCTGTSSAWAVAVQLGAGSAGIFRNNHIYANGAGTITIGIDGTGIAVANAIMMSNNFYGVSPGIGAVKNGGTTNFTIVQNFYSTIGGGAGFVISTITN